MKKGVVVTGIIVGVGALGLYLKNQYDLAQKLIYSIKKFTVSKVGFKDSVFNVVFQLENKDKLAAVIKDLNLKLSVDNTYLTTITEEDKFTISPFQTTEIATDFSINLQQIISENSGIIKDLTDYKNLPIKFDLKFKVKRLGIWIPLKFNFTYTIGEMM